MMIPVFFWCFAFCVISVITFLFIGDNRAKYSVWLCLIPILLFIFPFLLREKTIENKYGVFESQITKEGVPFIVNADSDIINLCGRVKSSTPVGTKIEIYTELGKYVRFFSGEETIRLYRIVKDTK